jgi:hypothetical protein
MKRSQKSFYCVILIICYFNDLSRHLHVRAALQNMYRLIPKAYATRVSLAHLHDDDCSQKHFFFKITT